MGAGVLPIARHNGEIYLLFSRERLIYNNDVDRGKWSDFGGGKEGNENQYQTAVRECYEESTGILGNKKNIRNLMKYNLVGKLTDRKYSIWIVEIKYNLEIVDLFHKHFKKVLKETPHIVKNKNGLYEKDKLKWIKLSSLKRHKKIFRPWYYKEYITKIINILKNK
jgi:8-oxo-dGTP pyrophosphatase MutT (NUDIX family)